MAITNKVKRLRAAMDEKVSRQIRVLKAIGELMKLNRKPTDTEYEASCNVFCVTVEEIKTKWAQL